MQNQPNLTNMQPTTQMQTLANNLMQNIATAMQTDQTDMPNANLTMQTLCQQTVESHDNSGCLLLAIAFNAPDYDEDGLAGDFALHAYKIALQTIRDHAIAIAKRNPGSTLPLTHYTTPYATNITLIQDEDLTYYNALVTTTDNTLYIHCTYNQQ